MTVKITYLSGDRVKIIENVMHVKSTPQIIYLDEQKIYKSHIKDIEFIAEAEAEQDELPKEL